MAEKTLVIACGALAKELFALQEMNEWDHYDVQCLDAQLHNRPSLIAARLKAAIDNRGKGYNKILIGYADCGTGGAIDELIAEDNRLERLPGPHCYSFFAGEEKFLELANEEPGTFYLTDFLVRHFETMVIRNLKLDKHPDLLDTYFGNYTTLVYLSQVSDEALVNQAVAAADRLGLKFRHIHTGYGGLEQALHIAEPA